MTFFSRKSLISLIFDQIQQFKLTLFGIFMLCTKKLTKIQNFNFLSKSVRPYPIGPFSRHSGVVLFSIKFFDSEVSLVIKTKKVEEESFLKFFLCQLEKRVFCHIYQNWSNSLKDNSITKPYIKKRKLILESPYLLLSVKIKILKFEHLRTSCWHLTSGS